MEQTYDWEERINALKAKWALAPDCPFCGANMKRAYVRWTTRKSAHKPHYTVQCLQCGAQGASGETEEEAVDNWNRRTASSYQPLGPHSYVLPMQALGSLVVHEDGRNISFIDWVDENVHQRVDIDLGKFRICYRHRGEEE